MVFPAAAPSSFFFFNDTATTEIYPLSLHDALPICDLELVRLRVEARRQVLDDELDVVPAEPGGVDLGAEDGLEAALVEPRIDAGALPIDDVVARRRFRRGPAEPRPGPARDDHGPPPA